MKKRIIAMIMILGVLLSGNYYTKAEAAATVQAKEQAKEQGFPRIMKLKYDDAADDNTFPVTPTRSRMTILADGVRLRVQPSSSAPILELMYRDEIVNVLILGSTWSNIRRLKTGTHGYCKTKYLGL